MDYITTPSGELYVQKTELPTGYGDYYAERIGNSLYVGEVAKSCFSFVVIDEKPTFTEPHVCEGCGHFIECHFVQAKEPRKYVPGAAILPKAFNVTRFVSENRSRGLVKDPENFNW